MHWNREGNGRDENRNVLRLFLSSFWRFGVFHWFLVALAGAFLRLSFSRRFLDLALVRFSRFLWSAFDPLPADGFLLFRGGGFRRKFLGFYRDFLWFDLSCRGFPPGGGGGGGGGARRSFAGRWRLSGFGSRFFVFFSSSFPRASRGPWSGAWRRRRRKSLFFGRFLFSSWSPLFHFRLSLGALRFFRDLHLLRLSLLLRRKFRLHSLTTPVPSVHVRHTTLGGGKTLSPSSTLDSVLESRVVDEEGDRRTLDPGGAE